MIPWELEGTALVWFSCSQHACCSKPLNNMGYSAPKLSRQLKARKIVPLYFSIQVKIVLQSDHISLAKAGHIQLCWPNIYTSATSKLQWNFDHFSKMTESKCLLCFRKFIQSLQYGLPNILQLPIWFNKQLNSGRNFPLVMTSLIRIL